MFIIVLTLLKAEAWSRGRVSNLGSEGRWFELRVRRDWTLCFSQFTQWARLLVDLVNQAKKGERASQVWLIRHSLLLNSSPIHALNAMYQAGRQTVPLFN